MMSNTNRQSSTKRQNLFWGLPLFCPILLGLAAISFFILIVARHNSAFAFSFNTTVGAAVRATLAWITNIFPFSFAELLIFLLPLFLFLAIFFALRHTEKSLKGILIYTALLISILSVLFTLFAFGFGTGYYTPSLEKQLDLASNPVSAEELKATALWLVNEIDQYRDRITYSTSGASRMPYSLNEMNTQLMSAYHGIHQKYPFIQGFQSNIKPVMSSVAMSYLHITGVYSFFTGEANLNVDFPDYTLPFTAAHEFAHQRGIARENEANFVAFLVCAASDDPYLQYSGYLNLYEYVIVALYSADPEAYVEVHSLLSEEARGEIRAYSAFYDKYRDSEAAKVGTAVNDAYLQANGNKEGTKSYGMVVDLAVAYYKTVICHEPS